MVDATNGDAAPATEAGAAPMHPTVTESTTDTNAQAADAMNDTVASDVLPTNETATSYTPISEAPNPATPTSGTQAAGSATPTSETTYTEIPEPPPSVTFASFQEVFDFLQEFYRNNGAAIVKRQSGPPRHLDGTKMCTHVGLGCDRGRSRPSASKGLRKATSFKTGCPVKLTAKTNKGLGGRWVYTVLEGKHNHPPSKEPSEHIVHRRRTPEQRALAASLAKHTKMSASEMAAVIRDSSLAPSFFSERDINNDRLKVQRNSKK